MELEKSITKETNQTITITISSPLFAGLKRWEHRKHREGKKHATSRKGG